MKLFLVGAFGAALLFSKSVHADASKPSYHVTATWKLSGDGGWDYLNVDSKNDRLYVARGNRIQVLNSDTGALVGEVMGLSGAHGVALDLAHSRAYATSGRSNSVIVFDTKTLKTIGDPIPVGRRPDAILFEPMTKTIWAFDAGSNAVSIIDPKTTKVTQTIELGGNPEFGVSDSKGHVWVNIENTSELVKLNAKTGAIMKRTALAPGEEPSGLAYDAGTGKLFSGCANKTMVVTDSNSGKIVSSLAVGDGIDAAAFDARRHLAFSSNGEDGTLSVVGQSNGKWSLLNSVPTHKGARTMTLDQKTGAIFVVAADYEAPEPAVAGQEPHWPKMVPGTAIVMKLVPDFQGH